MTRRLSVAFKLLFFVAISVLILVGLPTGINLSNIWRDNETRERESLFALRDGFYREAQRAEQALAALSLSLADRPDVQEALAQRDRTTLLEHLEPMFDALSADHDVTALQVQEPAGLVFLRVHDPQEYGDNITNRPTIATARDSRRTVSGLDIGLDGLAMRGISPIFHQRAFVGMLEVDRAYGSDLVQTLKTQTGADYKIWLTHRAATRVAFEPEAGVPPPASPELFYYAASDSRSLPISPEVYHRVLEDEQPEIRYVSESERDLAVLVTPLRAFRNQVVGVLEISIPRVQAASVLEVPAFLLIVAVGLALVTLILMGWSINQVVLRPLGQLTDVARHQLAGNLTARVELSTRDEFEQLGHTLNTLTEKLEHTLRDMEGTIEQRTRDLARRSAHLEASAEVSRVATAILEPNQLIQRSVDLIRERFGLYYVGLFLMDEAGEWAVLRAGTGMAGRAMLARGHRIRLGEGMIGWSITRARARVASQAQADTVRLATAELPETRSEAAIPLRSRGQVLGALSVQSTEPDAFDPAALAALQTMADHTAVALDNARLFAESQALLEATRQAYGQRTREAWTELLRARTDWGYTYDLQALAPVQGEWPALMRQAEKEGQTMRRDSAGDAKAPTLAIPIKVRENVIGVLGFSKEDAETPWTDEEVTLMETLTFQLGLALDGAQLYRDTERSAIREQLIGEVTGKLRETLDVETVLQTAAREVRQALDLPEVVVRLSPRLATLAGEGQGRRAAKTSPPAGEEKDA